MARRNPKLYIIFLTVFIDLIGFGIVLPILPLYAQHFGASETVNGWLVAIYSAAQLLAAPLLGSLSDRVGRRPVLFVSLLGTAVGFIIMGAAGALAWLFVARLIDGLSGGNIGTAQAYIADVTRPEDRSAMMGMLGAAIGVGFVIGPAIGGILSSKISMGAPFYFAGGLALLNSVLVYFRLPESLAKEHRVAPEEKASLFDVLQHGSHLPALMGSYFFAITGFSILTTNFALFTSARFGFDEAHNGYLFAFIGIVGVIMQGVVLRRVLGQVSEKRVAFVGAALLVLGMALLPVSAGLASLLTATAVIGIGNSFVTPTLNGLASRYADRSWQGRVVGLMQSAGSFGRFVGPFVGGWMLSRDPASSSHYGRTPFWVGSLVLLLALVCIMRLPSLPEPVEV